MVTHLFAEAEGSVTRGFGIRPSLSSVFFFLFFFFFTNVKTHRCHFHLAEIFNQRTPKKCKPTIWYYDSLGKPNSSGWKSKQWLNMRKKMMKRTAPPKFLFDWYSRRAVAFIKKNSKLMQFDCNWRTKILKVLKCKSWIMVEGNSQTLQMTVKEVHTSCLLRQKTPHKFMHIREGPITQWND